MCSQRRTSEQISLCFYSNASLPLSPSLAQPHGLNEICHLTQSLNTTKRCIVSYRYRFLERSAERRGFPNQL